ncbi:MAG: type II toxin-antitoxin system RelE/ParE family toxin [Flavobacteriales bacterium]|nr:type II toxin-antitoxin system RelE/ParE family toxin [Flavobacteriales bacterium]
MIRKIVFHKRYFIDFYLKQPKKVQDKIEYVFELIKQVERVPEKFLKHLSGTEGIYEIRIEYQSNIFRIFCFFDRNRLVVLLNALQKKSQKTPKKEIKLAKKLKKEYLNLKKSKR